MSLLANQDLKDNGVDLLDSRCFISADFLARFSGHPVANGLSSKPQMHLSPPALFNLLFFGCCARGHLFLPPMAVKVTECERCAWGETGALPTLCHSFLHCRFKAGCLNHKMIRSIPAVLVRHHYLMRKRGYPNAARLAKLPRHLRALAP